MTHGKNKKNFSICTAEEFIAAITQHIPDPSFQIRMVFKPDRGDREKQKLEEKEETETPDDDIEIIDVSKPKPRKIPPPTCGSAPKGHSKSTLICFAGTSKKYGRLIH